MTTIYNIVRQLNESNGKNHKLAVLKQHKDNVQLQRVLQMTFDKVKFTYGLSLKHWQTGGEKARFTPDGVAKYTLDDALDFMTAKLNTRAVTGNDAIEQMHEIFLSLTEEDRTIAMGVLNRDLRINVGKTLINKIFSDLIEKPVYMRCGIFEKKTAKNIQFPAILQLKADGTYRESSIVNGAVEYVSRSGESYEYPVLSAILSDVPDGYIMGELVVRGTANRGESNGLLNSDDVPHDRVDFFVWDYVTLEEYANAGLGIANKIEYKDRLAKLREIVAELGSDHVQVIEGSEVTTLAEALKIVSAWMEDEKEGGVMKDKRGLFRNGTSKHQLKLKLSMQLEVRIEGFTEGTPGTARESTFGSINYSTDDGMVKGSVSGFTKDQLKDFNSRRAELIGKIMTIEGNDLTQGRNNDYYALSHPRFVELRNDRTDTDDLARALQIKQMAMDLS